MLLATRPWVLIAFLRFMRTGGWGQGVGLAVVDALDMLGKYFSALLLRISVISACLHPPWRQILLSRRGAFCVGVRVLPVLPNVLWLVQTGFGPVRYAAQATSGLSGAALGQAAQFVLSESALALPPP